jgi:hypothetical protein
VAVRSEALVYNRLIAEIAISKPAEDIDVRTFHWFRVVKVAAFAEG